MFEMFELLERVSKTDSSVLIRGESGSGKELVANAIHRLSRRNKAPFKAINCATFSAELINSELFGHVKGAFTGAVTTQKGLFSAADTGTIFLDEIAELPVALQAKLLRVLQEKTFTPVGSTNSETVDVRFISATHTSLRKVVEQKKFREDLMYRIRVVPIFIPPLRERETDIKLLSNHFIAEFNQKKGFRTVEGITRKACELLSDYPWPGNIRELRNNIEYAFAVGTSSKIQAEDLTPELQGKKPNELYSFPESEKQTMLSALKKTGGNKGEAANVCGMSRTTFWRKARLYGIF